MHCLPQCQGGSSLPNPLEPLLSIRNHSCRIVLFEFRVVLLCRTYSNHCWHLQLMFAGQFYSSLCKFVSPEPTQTTSVSEESSPSESFTLVQGSSSLPNPLEPLLSFRNHVCRTVLLEFRVVLLCRTYSNHCWLLEIMFAGHFYSSSWNFVTPEPTKTTSVSEESSPSESFTQVQGGSSLPNPHLSNNSPIPRNQTCSGTFHDSGWFKIYQKKTVESQNNKSQKKIITQIYFHKCRGFETNFIFMKFKGMAFLVVQASNPQSFISENRFFANS